MILMGELPRDLETRIAAHAARRAITTYELLRRVMDEADTPGQTTMAALPFFVMSTPPNWEAHVRDWVARHDV